MMLQQQTLDVDRETRSRLIELSNLIHQHRNDPERVRELIAEHDKLVKGLSVKLYDQREEAKWVS